MPVIPAIVLKSKSKEEGINQIIKEYDLGDHVFTSAAYDLEPLKELGLKIRTVDLIKRAGL